MSRFKGEKFWYNGKKRIMMALVIENEHEISLNTSLLETISNDLSQRDVELMIVNDSEIHEINFEHRGKNEPTDVLSFPLELDVPMVPLGSIIISFETAQRVANEMRHDVKDEIGLLFIHGILHLLGYDHECDTGEMRTKEKELLIQYSLPLGLIERVDSLR
jgi:probable rRNA maturation factor